MVGFTFTAAAASLAVLASVANAAGGQPLFKVSTCASTKGSKFSGLYLSSVHTSAGESSIVAVPDKDDAIVVQFNGSMIVEHISRDVTYVLNLEDARPQADNQHGQPVDTAPLGYRLTTIGVDGETQDFSVPTRGAAKPITYRGPQNYHSFALCEVDGTEDVPGKAVQLLYRTQSGHKDESGQCEDVVLYALFEKRAGFPNAQACPADM